MKPAAPAAWMTDAWLAKSTIATKIATMSNGPKTLGRMPGAMRSDSSSLPSTDLPTAPRLDSAVPTLTLPSSHKGRNAKPDSRGISARGQWVAWKQVWRRALNSGAGQFDDDAGAHVVPSQVQVSPSISGVSPLNPPLRTTTFRP